MKIRVIAVSVDNNDNITGFRFLDSDNGQVAEYGYDKTKIVLQNKVPLYGLKLNRGKIIGSNGALSRYSTYKNGMLVKKAVIIIATIDNIGYRVCNHEGKIYDAKSEELISYCELIAKRRGLASLSEDAFGIANGKIVTKDGKKYISSIVGTYDNIPVSESNLKSAEKPNKDILTSSIDKSVVNTPNNVENTASTNNIKLNNNSPAMEIIDKKTSILRVNRDDNVAYPRVIRQLGNPSAVMKEIDEKTGMSLEDKWAKAVIALRDVRVFYYSIFMTLQVKEVPGLGTMGAAPGVIAYDPEFIREVTPEELLFILIHEICHIAMLHRAREEGRDHDIWNTAADLYINRNIAKEFCLGEVPGTTRYANSVAYKDPDKEPSFRTSHMITLPDSALFNPEVDVDKDVPEKLYDELLNSLNKNREKNADNIDTDKIREGARECNEQAHRDAQQAGNTPAANNAEKKVNEGAQQVTDGSHDIDNGRKMMNEGKEENNPSKIDNGRKIINQGLDDIENGAKKIAQGQKQMQDELNKQNQGNQQGQQGNQQGQQGNQQGQQGNQQGQQGNQQGQQGQGQQGQGQQRQGQQGQGQQSGQSGQQSGQSGQQSGQSGQQSGQSGQQSGLGKIMSGAGLNPNDISANNQNNISSNDNANGDSTDTGSGNGNGSRNDNGNGQSSAPKYNESDDKGFAKGNAENKATIGKSAKAESQPELGKETTGGGESNYNANEQRQKGRLEGVTFRGHKIHNGIENDIIDTEEEEGKSSDEIAREGKARLRSAVAIAKQMMKKSYGGDQAGFLERMIEEEIAPKINWKSVLRKYLTKANKKEYTFSHPDRRFLGQKSVNGRKQVYAGPHTYGGGELENIKIAIDTSGSISEKDLGIALAQIDDMFKQYGAKAELMYWDTRVRAVYEFKKVKELLSKKAAGGGGTDVNCVFDYFETNKDYKIHKKRKPSLIIIFTDGYFGTVDKQYAKKYKDTIWIIQGNDNFKAPFGIVAPLKVSEV